MKINIYLFEDDLEKHNNEYIIESFTESSIEKLVVGFYLNSQLNNW